MTVRDTSLEAYLILEEFGTHSKRARQVLAALLTPGLPETRQELARRLHIPINCICSPCLKLVELGLVVEENKRPCRVTGYTAWELTVKPRQGVLL